MTQTKSILAYMHNVGPITSLKALNLFGCLRLAARINDIKKLGVIIDKKMIMDYNVKKQYAQYSIHKEQCREPLF